MEADARESPALLSTTYSSRFALRDSAVGPFTPRTAASRDRGSPAATSSGSPCGSSPAPLRAGQSVLRLANEVIGRPRRQRLGWVKPGLAEPCVGKMLPSQTKRFGTSCAPPKASTTELSGSAPMRARPRPGGRSAPPARSRWRPAARSTSSTFFTANAVSFLSFSCSSKCTLATRSPKRSTSSASVTRFSGHGRISPSTPSGRPVVVVLHRLPQRPPPRPLGRGDLLGESDRQRPDRLDAEAAYEVALGVGLVEGLRSMALAGGRLVHPYQLIEATEDDVARLDHQVLAHRAARVGETVGERAGSRVEEEPRCPRWRSQPL